MITIIALVMHQKISNVQGITVVVSWMDNIICSRNVDLRLCIDDFTYMAFHFFTFFIACRCYSIYGSFDFTMAFIFGGSLSAQMDVYATLICCSF